MIRRRTPRTSARANGALAPGDVHDWVRSLPWVVEESADARWPDVRAFVVDCPPLQRHRFLVATHPAGQTALGERHGTHLAAIMPVEVNQHGVAEGCHVHSAIPLAAGHVLLTVETTTHPRTAIEAFVLAAYGYAMS